MRTLPNPIGPHLVGSSTREVADSSRASHILSQDRGRGIFAKLWYPASTAAPNACERERLWQQLDNEPDIPGIAKLLLRPAMKVLTNSYHLAPYATAAGPPRLLFYSHGLISFASENSMLMEHLASHGYVVISLQHKDQLAELRALQRAQHEDEKREQVRLERKIKTATVEERAALWKEYFQIASNTNRIASARAVDIEFAIGKLETLLEAVPGIDGISSTKVVGVLGLSLGGAVATEYSKRNSDGATCVANIDGGMYGTQSEKPISGRYLMLYSQQNSGTNDLSLTMTDRAAVTRKVIPGTKHLNFHDIAAVYPALRWLGATGSARPMAVVEERNRLVSDFVSNG